MASEQNAVYCTLLLSDNYLPGAMVLAHSLRDNGTRARLVALFTPTALRQETIDELRTVYDELIAVHSFVNGRPANLWLMDRPDLIATFTKIELWRLTQFDRVVYIDCDVVALRAPDELLTLEVDFAAAPDVGWPDCFNSGLMALRPNMQDYYALKALAERGISFDGADQGLLNMHFRDWHRLSFTYNCTPSANYQYIPAYKHFQSTISLIHFIGSRKPWNMPRHVVPMESPYNQLLNKWWAVYDRHYHPQVVSTQQLSQIPQEPATTQRSSDIAPSGAVQIWPEPQQVHHVHGHGDGRSGDTVPNEQSSWQQHSAQESHGHGAAQQAAPPTERPVLSIVPQYVRGEENVSTYVPPQSNPPAPIHHVEPSLESQPVHREHHEHHERHEQQEHHELHEHHEPSHDTSHIHHPQPIPPPPVTEIFHRPPSPEPESPKFEAPKAEWDAEREPPPLNTKPEGISLQEKTYTMSEDTKLFQPPPSYPEAPKNMYYQVPTTKPTPQKMSQIFPWERHAARPTRVFPDEQSPPPAAASPEQPSTPEPTLPNPALAAIDTTPTRVPFEPSAESWDSYSRSNAWDDDPSIQRYIESIQAARKPKTQVVTSDSAQTSPDNQAATAAHDRRPSFRLTDFPTEVERPSLPVTPAPVERRWSADNDGDSTSAGTSLLPAAEGVPAQEDWVGVTVDAFSQLLNATYLLWRSTESPSSSRRASSEAVRGVGASGAV
ncbi:hypothetical protein N7509_002517 [Penicillium cosmopolitanum]|uniref:glycogenin glucosyltransferase n=1 Tax=Penicillium cosmopolitanum TaxID=1131564 RepID=A0A9W9W992_9EURO|nr:uncharacterized protein N7509_002517 [Penicillium cosmopolitanum]KAJ5408634.1 hypothetical protein N7509_002517 [Penicillium cosmopolitanum]